jgi:small subunit ribosomal protein S21
VREGGVLSEIRKREYYEKPSVKRKRKLLAAKKKALKAKQTR